MFDGGGVGAGLVEVRLGAHDVYPRLDAGVEEGLRLPLERLALAQRLAANALKAHGAQNVEVGHFRGKNDFHSR